MLPRGGLGAGVGGGSETAGSGVTEEEWKQWLQPGAPGAPDRGPLQGQWAEVRDWDTPVSKARGVGRVVIFQNKVDL